MRSFLIQPFTVMNFPLSIALATSYKFWYVIFLFSFNSKYFLTCLVTSLTQWFFRHVLLNFHVFMNSQISIIDLEFPCIVVRGHTLHGFNPFQSVESCFTAEHTVYLGEYSMCAWQNPCSVSGAGQKKRPLTFWLYPEFSLCSLFNIP